MKYKIKILFSSVAILSTISTISIVNAKPISSSLALNTTVTSQYKYSDAEDLLNQALDERTFYKYNLAYEAISKIGDSIIQAELMSKLATIANIVWTPEIAQVSSNFSKLIETNGSGKIYDETEAYINGVNINATDKAYLLGELTSWGRKLVFTDDYKLALDGIIEAWNSINRSNISQAVSTAERRVNNVKNSASRDYLLEQLNQIKDKLCEASTEPTQPTQPTPEPKPQEPTQPKNEAGVFVTADSKLVTINKNVDYDVNISQLNTMIGNTFGFTYVPSLTQDGVTSGTAKFIYDKANNRYGLQVSSWRHSDDSSTVVNRGLNVILETFYFFSGDKDVAKSLWKWFDAKNINGQANTDDFGFKDTATFKNGFTAIKNGVEIDITEVNGVTTVYFH